jgi:hypothetical protein
MKLNEIVTESADIRDDIEDLARSAQVDAFRVTKKTINNKYDEYVIDVNLPKEVFNDREFTQLPTIKKLRAAIKQKFGENNIRQKAIVGMKMRDDTGRLVFQVKRDSLTEAVGNQKLGIIIERDKETGEFEDVAVVEFPSMNKVSGHAANLAKSFYDYLREHQLYDHIESILKKHIKAQPAKGWGDDENFTNTLYGPIDINKFGQIEELLK